MDERDHKAINEELNPPSYLDAISDRVLKIKLHEYDYHCGDGCCSSYGTITTINNIELPCHNQDTGAILTQILEHLGYKVDIEYSDDIE